MKLQFDKATKRYRKFANPTELIGDAIMDGIVKAAPAGWLYHLKLKDVTSSHVQENPKNNLKSVHATGTGMLRKHRLQDDRLFPDKQVSFEIEFQECLDEIGQPDIKIIKFNFKE